MHWFESSQGNHKIRKLVFYTSFCYAAGPVGPWGIVKFSIKLGAVPVIVASASVPGAPVVTVPIVNVGVSASAPVGPVGPISPVKPVGPVHPTKSVKNNESTENKGNEARSRYTFFGTKDKKSYVFE